MMSLGRTVEVGARVGDGAPVSTGWLVLFSQSCSQRSDRGAKAESFMGRYCVAVEALS